MNTECRKCESLYDNQQYKSCPKCQQEHEFEFGLQVARENKNQREKNKVDIIKQLCYKYNVDVEATWKQTGLGGGTPQLHHKHIGMKNTGKVLGICQR